MRRSTRPLRTRVVLAVSTVALAVAAPLVGGAPSYAGFACGAPAPVPGDDCTAPTTVVTSRPDAETGSRVAGFAFEASAPEMLGVDFACKLEGPSEAHDWRDCTDAAPFGQVPQTGSTSYQDLALGSYTFSVRATDRFLLGPNTEDPPVQVTWQVVAADPDPDPVAPADDDHDGSSALAAGALHRGRLRGRRAARRRRVPAGRHREEVQPALRGDHRDGRARPHLHGRRGRPRR